VIIATAGHIDHGKTTLVKALTGVDTDRLPEEKARGISIDLGFAYWKTPHNDTIGFVDVPGHERFVRNMLAGVCGIDYVMLIVAADDGVMPQTVEHLHIVDLLAIGRGICVITKTDRIGADRVAEVAASVRALLAPTRLAGINVLPVSAVSGEGVDKLR
jgi:selenocysteine-specific elongation factor